VNSLSHTTLLIKLSDRLMMDQPITTAGAAFRVSSVPSTSRISELEVVYAYICGSYTVADTIKIDESSKHTNRHQVLRLLNICRFRLGRALPLLILANSLRHQGFEDRVGRRLSYCQLC